ncbi:MAG: 50S ribosomal protein L28 [Anaerolinea sp.]|nr:50S ribosomal protein L28 [Anaerolinea sp.]
MTSKHKITRTKPMFGNKRSFSMRATRRKFNPNLQSASIYVEETGQFVKVRVTARELRTIDKIGLPEFLRRQGLSLKALTE